MADEQRRTRRIFDEAFKRDAVAEDLGVGRETWLAQAIRAGGADPQRRGD